MRKPLQCTVLDDYQGVATTSADCSQVSDRVSVRALREHIVDESQLELPPGHALRTLPNVLATPHLGYVTGKNYATYFAEAVEDIEAFLDGTPIRLLT